jgi:3-methyladenine DNA glycosylase AlkD
MNKIEEKFTFIRKFCASNTDEATIKKYARYFKEGYDAYGLGREKFETQRDKWLEDWKGVFTFDDYLALGEKLIATGKYEEASYAVSFIANQKEQLKAEHFKRLGDWLEKGICNWGHTDIFCGHVLSHFICTKIIDIKALEAWRTSDSKWKRRAVPVTLIDALKTDIPLKAMLALIDPLMSDKEEMVQKGLGWFLREAWKRHPAEIELFLMKWKDTCGRIIIQYATEKMDKSYRLKFRRAK